MSRLQCRGWSLLAGGVLTCIWVLISPTYVIHGPQRYESTFKHYSGQGDGYHLEDQQFHEPATFWSGVILIWSAVGAGYCLWPSLKPTLTTDRPAEDPIESQ